MQAAAVRRAASLLLVFCFSMFISLSAAAAERGQVHHVDTEDYCLQAGNVTVGLSELGGLDDGQKQALVESASGYAFYLWKVTYRVCGESAAGTGDFSAVNWEREGTYEIRVAMPSLTEGVASEISYILRIINDLPEEPEQPCLYRITVRYLEEETGNPLKEDYVIDTLEEGTVHEIDEESLLPPEGWDLAEIRGDLEGEIVSDREILVICRPREPEPQEPEEPGDGGNPEPEVPEEGQTGTSADQEEGNSSGSGSGNSSGKTGGKNVHAAGKNNGRKSPGSGKGESSGKTAGSSSFSDNKSSVGRTVKAASPAVQAAEQSEGPAEETVNEQEVLLEESVPAAEEDIPAPEETDTAALPPAENKGAGQSSIGGAVLPQTQEQKERYPLWSLTLGIAESSILVVLGSLIFSDLKLIRWFERKKRG